MCELERVLQLCNGFLCSMQHVSFMMHIVITIDLSVYCEFLICLCRSKMFHF